MGYKNTLSEFVMDSVWDHLGNPGFLGVELEILELELEIEQTKTISKSFTLLALPNLSDDPQNLLKALIHVAK